MWVYGQQCKQYNSNIIIIFIVQVFNSHCLPGNKLGDYCDGELYKECELFREDPCALQIQMYDDEADVCNEIGSKCTVHKLGKYMYNTPPY